MTATNFQAGITDPAPEHVLVAALDFTQRDPANSIAALRQLQTLVRRELDADIDEIDPDTNPAVPTADAGELGVDTGYDPSGLTITMGLSTTGFQALGVAGPDLPADLYPIDWEALHDLPVTQPSGDLVVQVCADSAYIVEHVLRRIEHTLASSFTVVWTLLGEQRNGASHSNAGQPITADSARALIGFHDGLSNLNPADPGDQELIFVDPASPIPYPPTPAPGPQPQPGPGQTGYGTPGSAQPIFPPLKPSPGRAEPAWAKDGTYLMVRAATFDHLRWDQQALQTQQDVIGRWKYSGAALDNTNSPAYKFDPPAFTANPTAPGVPANSHIRRANPRRPGTDDQNRRIHRRGYPLLLADGTGTLRRGLLFLGYARSLSTQLDFIMRAWLKNPDFPIPGSGVDAIFTYEPQSPDPTTPVPRSQVLAGGFYFVPPVKDPSRRWDWLLPGL